MYSNEIHGRGNEYTFTLSEILVERLQAIRVHVFHLGIQNITKLIVIDPLKKVPKKLRLFFLILKSY